jgi:hypothetical protein
MLGCAALLGAATDAVKEPATGVSFPAKLDVKGGSVSCTGVDVRTKYFIKVYALGHYGDPKAWPAKGTPEDKAQHWIAAPALKVFSLRFTYNVTKEQIRGAWEEGLDAAKYQDKATRAAFLGAFASNLAKGDELRFIAQADGTLSAEHNGKELGSWKDAALVKAIWTIWLGENSVAKNRLNLVARAPQP